MKTRQDKSGKLLKMKNIIMKRILGYTAPAVAMLLALAGCKKQSLETTYSSQEDRIDSFIESLASQDPAPRVVHNSGSNRIVLTEGSGDELAPGGTVSFYYAGYIFNGSAPSANYLFTTNREETAAESGWTVTSPDYSILTLTLDEDAGLVEGLMNGLAGVKGGEICYIVFSGKYGFGDEIVGTIPANSALIYQIWVESLTND